ncbi:hypothetical protein Anas_06345 [Armadillidium nasatum]|uniref:Uncharacterized protein n=1 Tax=Armadillidium nasatum TaxID=96803 RepID=A0A5N5SXX9_9CRUS|nr:hypothetical protein Anas_06345 [Armadillidium nasatum]
MALTVTEDIREKGICQDVILSSLRNLLKRFKSVGDNYFELKNGGKESFGESVPATTLTGF